MGVIGYMFLYDGGTDSTVPKAWQLYVATCCIGINIAIWFANSEIMCATPLGAQPRTQPSPSNNPHWAHQPRVRPPIRLLVFAFDALSLAIVLARASDRPSRYLCSPAGSPRY